MATQVLKTKVETNSIESLRFNYAAVVAHLLLKRSVSPGLWTHIGDAEDRGSVSRIKARVKSDDEAMWYEVETFTRKRVPYRDGSGSGYEIWARLKP